MQPTCAHPDCLTPCTDLDYCATCCAHVCPEHRIHQHVAANPTEPAGPAEHWSPRWHDDP